MLTGRTGTELTMSFEWTDSIFECDEFAPAEMERNDPLAWYKVVGIELALFVGIVAPLICGAFLAR